MSYRADVIRYVLGDGRQILTATDVADQALGVADASGASRQVLTLFTPRAIAANLIVMETKGIVERAGTVRDPRAGRAIPRWKAVIGWLDGVPALPESLKARWEDGGELDELQFLRDFADESAALLNDLKRRIDALAKRYGDRYAAIKAERP